MYKPWVASPVVLRQRYRGTSSIRNRETSAALYGGLEWKSAAHRDKSLECNVSKQKARPGGASLGVTLEPLLWLHCSIG